MSQCEWIEGNLNILPNHFSPCCAIFVTNIPHYKRKDDGKDIENYKKFISDFYQKMQNDENYCKGCKAKLNRPPRALNHENIVFSKIMINIHQKLCNCKCAYCTIDTSIKTKVAPLEPIIAQLEATGSLSKETTFNWGGGEPTIFKEFYTVAPKLAEKGYMQHVFSNGIVFSPFLSNILEQGLGSVTISLDSYDHASFIKMKNVDRFNDVVKHIKRYLSAAKNKNMVIVKYIITEANNDYTGIKKFLSSMADMGVRVVLASPDFHRAQEGSLSESTKNAAKFLFSEARKMNCFHWCGPFYDSLFEKFAKEAFQKDNKPLK